MVETYDKDHVKTLKDATQYMKDIVAFWNSTLRPHESPREFIRASLKYISQEEADNPPY